MGDLGGLPGPWAKREPLGGSPQFHIRPHHPCRNYPFQNTRKNALMIHTRRHTCKRVQLRMQSGVRESS